MPLLSIYIMFSIYYFTNGQKTTKSGSFSYSIWGYTWRALIQLFLSLFLLIGLTFIAHTQMRLSIAFQLTATVIILLLINPFLTIVFYCHNKVFQFKRIFYLLRGLPS